MKKSVLIILVILTLPSILAIDLTFSKTDYQPQETMQAEIVGNFISLTKDNIFIYTNNKTHPEPVIKDLIKFQNKYYFYAVLPNYEGNFTFTIENIEYLQRGKIITEPITRDFKIIYKNTSDLSINPGFATVNKDFNLKIKSLFTNQEVTATLEETGESHTISLIESLEETINFKTPETLSQISYVKIKDYSIPVFNLKTPSLDQEITLEFIPYELRGTIIPENEYSFKIIIKNPTNKNLTDITFSSSIDAIIIPNEIEILRANAIEVINLTISVSEAPESFSGKLTAKIVNNTFDLPIYFNITQDETEVDLTDASDVVSEDFLSCSDIGTICSENQICNSETTPSLEGSCCLGDCIEEEKSSYSTYVGIILILILIAIVIFFIWKIRKKQKQKIKSPAQLLKEKSDKYKERMQNPESQEVSKSLDKI